jgi:predicted dehydrogenase
MRTSRRNFLILSAAGAAASQSFGQSANDRLGVALIGCGGRGGDRLRACMKLADKYNAECVALCDVWKKNLDSMADWVEKNTGKRPKTFSRYADLLALPEVDAVIITTPDFAHSPILIDAAEAKKHAYVEKPMAVRVEDARDAVDAVERSGIVCQVGTQKRSEGLHIAAAKLIQSGVLGTLIKSHSSYVRNVPSWKRSFSDVREEDVDWEQFLMYLPEQPFDARKFRCWHLYRDLCHGLVGLLGVHPIDVSHMYTDDPLPLTAAGMETKRVWTDREHADTQECLYTYPKGHLMQFTGRLGNSNGGAQNVFYGSRGTFDTAAWTATGAGGIEKDAIKKDIRAEAAPTVSHMENWLMCIRENNRNTNATVHHGYAHSVASIMGALACADGKMYRYNAETRTISEG